MIACTAVSNTPLFLCLVFNVTYILLIRLLIKAFVMKTKLSVLSLPYLYFIFLCSDVNSEYNLLHTDVTSSTISLNLAQLLLS